MKNFKRGLYLLSLVLSPLLVHAQLTQSILTTYQEFYGWFDFFIYLLIFIGVAREFVELKAKKDNLDVGPGGQALYVGLGLLLATALVTWEVKAGFSLISLGPIVLILLGIIFLVRVFAYAKDKNLTSGSLKSLALLLLIIIAIIYLFFPGILLYYFWASWIGTLLLILFLIALAYLIISSAVGIGKSLGGEGDSLSGGATSGGREPRVTGEGLKDAGKWITKPFWWPFKKLGEGIKYGLKELGVPGIKYAGRELVGPGVKGLAKGGYKAGKYIGKKPFEAGAYVGKKLYEKDIEMTKQKGELKKIKVEERLDALRNMDLSIICYSKDKKDYIKDGDIIMQGDLIDCTAFMQNGSLEEFDLEWKLNNLKIKDRGGRIIIDTDNYKPGGYLITLTAIDQYTKKQLAETFRFNLQPSSAKPAAALQKSGVTATMESLLRNASLGIIKQNKKLKDTVEGIENDKILQNKNQHETNLREVLSFEANIANYYKSLEFEIENSAVDNQKKLQIKTIMESIKTKGQWRKEYVYLINQAIKFILNDNRNDCLKALNSVNGRYLERQNAIERVNRILSP